MNTQLEAYKTYCLNIKKSLVNFHYLRPFLVYLEEKKLEFHALTKDQLAQYFTDREYKPKSINAIIGACRDFCKYEGIVDHACFQIKLLEVENKNLTKEYLTYEELLEGIKQYATYNKRGMSANKCSVVLKFCFFTSIRKGELLSLKREKIDLTTRTVKIWGQKDKTERLVIYPDNFSEELINYFNSEAEVDNAFNITIPELTYLTKKIGKYLNKHLYPHSLRRSGAKYMAKKNISPFAMQRILGHENLSTTLIYCELDDKSTQEIYRKQIG